MLVLLRYIILITLLRMLEAQDNNQKEAFNVTSDQSTISLKNSTHWPEIDSQEHDTGKDLITTEEPATTTMFPPIRCFSCAYCDVNEGKTLSDMGKQMCPIKPGVLHGCISIFLKVRNTAGGREGFMVRGCIADLEDGMVAYCKLNVKLCHKCVDADCNVVDITKDGLVTGGEARTVASMHLVIIGLVGLLSRWP